MHVVLIHSSLFLLISSSVDLGKPWTVNSLKVTKIYIHLFNGYFQLEETTTSAQSLTIFCWHLNIWLCRKSPLPSNRRHLSCDDCLEDKREDYQNCSVCTIVHSHKHAHMSSSYRCTRDCWFRFSLGYFVCFECFFLPKVSLFVCLMVSFLFFGVFSIVCFELPVPVQVIAWKDSSPKWPIMCRAGR